MNTSAAQERHAVAYLATEIDPFTIFEWVLENPLKSITEMPEWKIATHGLCEQVDCLQPLQIANGAAYCRVCEEPKALPKQ